MPREKKHNNYHQDLGAPEGGKNKRASRKQEVNQAERRKSEGGNEGNQSRRNFGAVGWFENRIRHKMLSRDGAAFPMMPRGNAASLRSWVNFLLLLPLPHPSLVSFFFCFLPNLSLIILIVNLNNCYRN